jgi:eukaryotic-like serine/threonine-protein kinase
MKIRVRYRDNRRELKRGTVRWFGISVTLLSMAAVALLSALLTIRIAIHASEVEVPNVAGLTVDEAADKTHDAQLNVTVENRFYSTTVPAGRVLSQLPAPGTSVRKGWHMRITESMGPQRATIPDTIGMDQRDAAAAIRRSQMELGTVAHLPAPGPADVVLAQTPPPNAEGVDKPEVSLLVSQAFANAPRAYVMPNLVGLSFSVARARMKEMNLPLWAIVPQSAPAPVAPTADGAVVGDAPAAPAPVVIAGPIASQVPVAGARVTAADNPHVTMTKGYSAPAPAATATPASAGAPLPTVAQPAAPVVRVPPAQH